MRVCTYVQLCVHAGCVTGEVCWVSWPLPAASADSPSLCVPGCRAGRRGSSTRPPWPRSLLPVSGTCLVVCSLVSGVRWGPRRKALGSQGEACNAWVWSTAVPPTGLSPDPPVPSSPPGSFPIWWLAFPVAGALGSGCRPSGRPVGQFAQGPSGSGASAAGRPHEAPTLEPQGLLAASSPCDPYVSLSVPPTGWWSEPAVSFAACG